MDNDMRELDFDKKLECFDEPGIWINLNEIMAELLANCNLVSENYVDLARLNSFAHSIKKGGKISLMYKDTEIMSTIIKKSNLALYKKVALLDIIEDVFNKFDGLSNNG